MDKTNISLNYKVDREKLRTGDLVVFSNKKFSGISGLITFIVRFFTISEYNTLSKTHNVILKTLNIKVSNVNAISSTFTFNHKKERIIFWCDGVADARL